MIKFHKVSSPPKAVPAGEEHIWFADYGAIYVSNNKGKPHLITAGTQVGENIPTGKPNEPNILYYCKKNKKHYISGLDKWIEIPTKSIPGTGGGAGTAGTVMVEDLNDWYTSVDVEGVLNEIGAAFPHFFGKKLLKDYADDTKKINYPSELHLTATATNLPSKGRHGWQNTRVASDGNSYGTFVADDNSAYTVVNQKYYKLAGDKELQSLEEVVDRDLGKLSKAKITVGEGLKTNDKGIGDGLKIEVDYVKLAKLHNHDERYVKKAGDTMTGVLNIHAKTGDSIAYVQSNVNNNKIGLYYNPVTNNSGIYDYTNGAGVIRYNAATGRTALYAYDRMKKGDEAPMSGRFDVYSDKQMNFNAQQVGGNELAGAIRMESGKTTRTLRVQNASGGLTFGSSGNTNFIDSTTRNVEASRNLTIGGGGSGRMGDMTVNATRSNFMNDLNVYKGAYIGMDPATGHGTGMEYAKIYLFPFETSSAKGKEHYTHFGYSQTTQTLHIRSYSQYERKDTNPGNATIKVGSKVIITRPVDYNGTHLSVGGTYTVMEVIGKRIVVGRGGVITAAMHVSNLELANPPKSTTTTTQPNPLTVKATKFTNTSSIKYKDVDGEFEGSALDTVVNTPVYKYNFKNDPRKHKSIGLIIEKGAPKEIVDEEGDAIDSYAMTSYLWKAVQELSAEVEALKKAK